MIVLNDYLYNGDTVIKILHNYSSDLRSDAKKTGNQIDMIHSNFLLQMSDLLEHNDFLTSQSQRIREFYKYMTEAYPDLSFTFKGRIKSLIRAESKFNGQVASYIYEYHRENGTYPSVPQIRERLSTLKDLIAYRIIISIPKCRIRNPEERAEKEIKYLYDIANILPAFLEERGFEPQPARLSPGKKYLEYKNPEENEKSLLTESMRPYYKDYVSNKISTGYKSLHITFYDSLSRSFIEVQLRTYDMDNFAEIGPANHMGYEERQKEERSRRGEIPVGECTFFDDAYERVIRLQEIKLNEIDVNMFAAASNSMVNDGCGLYKGRLILPYEHLSRFQNDLID